MNNFISQAIKLFGRMYISAIKCCRGSNLFSNCGMVNPDQAGVVIWVLAIWITPCGALHLILEKNGEVFCNRTRNAPCSLAGFTCDFSIPFSLHQRNVKLDYFIYNYGPKGKLSSLPSSQQHPFAYMSRLGPPFETKYPEGWRDVVNYDDSRAVAALSTTTFITTASKELPTLDCYYGHLIHSGAHGVEHKLSDKV